MMRHVDIFTDGACVGNPGPGGYGLVLKAGHHRRELSGGYRETTNSRMEILAAIVGLEALKEPCEVRLYSDSEYVARMMAEGWPRIWAEHGWKRAGGKRVLNRDLWERLLALCERHQVGFEWLKGHAGDPENERCDELARAAARQPNLPADEGYEAVS